MMTLTRLCAAILASSIASVTGQDLAGRAVDASVTLDSVSYVESSDRRDRLAMFGLRPTLVVVAAIAPGKKSRLGEYVKAIKRLDKKAKSWRKSDIDVVLFVWPLWMHKNGKPEALPLLERAKPKHMIASVVNLVDVPPGLADAMQHTLLAPVVAEQLDLRWAFMPKLGVIEACGDDVFAKSVGQLLTAAVRGTQPPRALQKATQAMATWNLGEADRLLAVARSAGATDAARLAELDARLTGAVDHFRRVFVQPHVDRGYLPEAVVELDRLAALLGESARCEAVARERESITGSDSYATVLAQHAAFVAIKRAYAVAEQKIETDYEKRVGRHADYDEAAYYECISRHMPAVRDAIEAHMREHSESPYRRAAAELLYEVRSMLTAPEGG